MIKEGLRRLQLTEPLHGFYKAVLRGKEGLSGNWSWCVLYVCVCAHLCSVFPPAAQEFIHRKCAGSIMPGCLIQSDTESLLRGEVSMSGRSSQGMQTVDKIFNMPL